MLKCNLTAGDLRLRLANAHLHHRVLTLTTLAQIGNHPVERPLDAAEVVSSEAEVETALPATLRINPGLSKDMRLRYKDVIEVNLGAWANTHAGGAVPVMVDLEPLHAGLDNHHQMRLHVISLTLDRRKHNGAAVLVTVSRIVFCARDDVTTLHFAGRCL